MTLAVRNAQPIATTTAGLRGTQWEPGALPSNVRVSVQVLKTSDGASVTGLLMERGGEDTVVCAMHPREMNPAHYLAPAMLTAGSAFWVQGSRTPNVDLRLEHETALLDLAAGQSFLRSAGYRKTVLMGTSGGGPLAAFYCQQAALEPDARLATTPAGRATKLLAAQMPEPDGVILISSHLGQGVLLARCLDPSVTSETDPFSVDEVLNPFSATNGFRPPPESSRYSEAFVRRYRTAQQARVARLDLWARELLATTDGARKRLNSGDAAAAAVAAWSPVMEIWRTDADLRCWDLSLEPSERAYGSLWGGDPFKSNFGSVGFARLCTPQSWLSTWSASSSNASMEKCAADLRQPVCMIRYKGDNSVFVSEADELFERIGSGAKERHDLPGNHHGRPIAKGEPDGRRPAADICTTWLSDNGFI